MATGLYDKGNDPIKREAVHQAVTRAIQILTDRTSLDYLPGEDVDTLLKALPAITAIAVNLSWTRHRQSYSTLRHRAEQAEIREQVLRKEIDSVNQEEQ